MKATGFLLCLGVVYSQTAERFGVRLLKRCPAAIAGIDERERIQG